MSVDVIAEAMVKAARSVGKQIEDRLICQLADLKEALGRLQEAQAVLASDQSRGIEVLDANVVSLQTAREELQRRAAADAMLDDDIAALREAIARLPAELPAYGEPLAELSGALADCRRQFAAELTRLIGRLGDAERGCKEIESECQAAAGRLAGAIGDLAGRQNRDTEDLAGAIERVAGDLAGCRRDFDDRLAAAAERQIAAENAAVAKTAALAADEALQARFEQLLPREALVPIEAKLPELAAAVAAVAGMQRTGPPTRGTARCGRERRDG